VQEGHQRSLFTPVCPAEGAPGDAADTHHRSGGEELSSRASEAVSKELRPACCWPGGWARAGLANANTPRRLPGGNGACPNPAEQTHFPIMY
jgi:hypothetical protein